MAPTCVLTTARAPGAIIDPAGKNVTFVTLPSASSPGTYKVLTKIVPPNMTTNLPALNTARGKRLISRIATAQKQADLAKKAAKLAKLEYRNARQKFKQAKRTAKTLRKEVKTLKAELTAVAVKRRSRKPAAPKRSARRSRPTAAHTAASVPVAAPLGANDSPPVSPA